MKRSGLFFAIALITTAVMIAVWCAVLLTGGRDPVVPEGQTRTVEGVAWHLDWLRLAELDDPVFDETYVDTIDGAVYVVGQFTYEASDELRVCLARVLGADRQWMAYSVVPVSSSTDAWCQLLTAGTLQVVATVPPSAVAEIQGIQVVFGDKSVRLLGSLTD